MIFQLGLVGYPLGFSLSPRIHTAALKSCGLEGDYSLFPVHPEDRQGLKNLVARVRDGEIHGLNVTIPYKQTVMPLLDELTHTAKMIGAVNTIFMQDGKLTGDNTDAPGFLTDLQKFLTEDTPQPEEQGRQAASSPELRTGSGRERGTQDPGREHRPETGHMRRNGNTKSALIFGAGGSARAVVYTLLQDGWQVTVASRRIEQAQALIAQLPTASSHLSNIQYHPSALRSLFSHFSLLINTTPLGMSPDVEQSPWPANLSLPPDIAVYDLVYNPRETKLVRDARAAGLIAATGLGMLIEQAALSFQIWTGRVPSRDALKAAVH